MNREDVIEAQTSAVYKMAKEKHGIILEADFLEDMLQTALDAVFAYMPVSEDKAHWDEFANSGMRFPEESDLTGGSTDCNQPTDTQDNDGWIEWKGGKSMPDNIRGLEAECKLRNGWVRKAKYCNRWNHYGSHTHSGDYDIIAYRIIDEPKEEKPKKQTLWEYGGNKHDLEFLSPLALFKLISEYLEQVNK